MSSCFWFPEVHAEVSQFKQAPNLTASPLLLNWFRAKGEISSGSVEGMNTKAKVALRKSYGFKTFEVYQTVLYHELGKLPEPDIAHRFC